MYRWVPMGRWNWEFTWPVNNDQFYPDIVIGLLLVWMARSFAQVRRVSMWLGTSLLALWTAVHFFDWGIPYPKKPPKNLGHFSFYTQHPQILPWSGKHIPSHAGPSIR